MSFKSTYNRCFTRVNRITPSPSTTESAIANDHCCLNVNESYRERKIRRNMLTANPIQAQVRCLPDMGHTEKERGQSHEWALIFMLPA